MFKFEIWKMIRSFCGHWRVEALHLCGGRMEFQSGKNERPEDRPFETVCGPQNTVKA